MRLRDIDVGRVLGGANWLARFPEGEERDNPVVKETERFGPQDQGLFSAVMKMNDGSEHPTLALKSFEEGGLHTDTFVHTKAGWLNIFEEGFMRAVGKYHHDIFPYEIYIGKPWKEDRELAEQGPQASAENRRRFNESVVRLRGTLHPV